MPTNEGKFRRVVIGIDEVGRAAPKGRASPNRRIAIGIDEVGRGALAGPVVLAAVLRLGRVSWFHPELGRIRDSKKLTPARREAWAAYLTRHPALKWRIARIGPAVIDRINIARAANLGAYRAYQRIIRIAVAASVVIARSRATKQSHRQEPRLLRSRRNDDGARFCMYVLLDGGLTLPPHIAHRTIIKGDERLPLIAAASIIAKVHRDRFMTRLAVAIPQYGFEIHKGYGTRLHRRALRRHGPSAVHRRSFLR